MLLDAAPVDCAGLRLFLLAFTLWRAAIFWPLSP